MLKQVTLLCISAIRKFSMYFKNFCTLLRNSCQNCIGETGLQGSLIWQFCVLGEIYRFGFFSRKTFHTGSGMIITAVKVRI